MKKIIIFSTFLLLVVTGCKKKRLTKQRLCARIDFERIVELFPVDHQATEKMVQEAIQNFDQAIERIGSVNPSKRIYQNSLLPYEQAQFQFTTARHVCTVLNQLTAHPDVARSTHEALQQLKKYDESVLQNNETIYRALKQYQEHGQDTLRRVASIDYFLRAKLGQTDNAAAAHAQAAEQLVDNTKREVQAYSAYYDHEKCLQAQNTNFSVDDYFPLSKTIPLLLQRFQDFFHFAFELQPVDQLIDLWTADLTCYRIRSLKNQAILGYLFFDLYARPGNKQHVITFMPLIPAIRDDCSFACVAASVVVADFEKNNPMLLSLDEVVSLFVSIGQALHEIVGATRFTQFSGNQTNKDFALVPGLLFAHFFDLPEMLQAVSSHYQTGKPLSYDQAKQITTYRMCSKNQVDLLDEQSPCNDLWAHIIAADLFDYMCTHGGIFDHEMGTHFINEILSPGGSREPHRMISRFLGRDAASRAYLERL